MTPSHGANAPWNVVLEHPRLNVHTSASIPERAHALRLLLGRGAPGRVRGPGLLCAGSPPVWQQDVPARNPE
eukprot:162518-Chlamydomonas_euryale.AAC.1